MSVLISKKFFLRVGGLVLMTIFYANIAISNDSVSHTHFSTRPQFQSSSPEFISGCRYKKSIAQESSIGGQLQAVFFGGASDSARNIGKYFMPFKSASAQVSEVLVDDASTTLHAQHFNILTQVAQAASLHVDHSLQAPGSFKSTISLSPRQWSAGLGLNYRHILFGKDSDNPFWIGVSVPILHVEQDLRLKEVIEADGGGASTLKVPGLKPFSGTMKEALQQQSWLYGKMKNNELSRTGIGDIDVRFGVVALQTESVVFDISLGVIIPSSNKQKNQYVFEPRLGNGKHLGLMGNGQFFVALWENDAATKQFFYEISFNVQYLFKNTQNRSFDLIGKPFSRYMEMYANEAQMNQSVSAALPIRQLLATPGINILSREVSVDPGINVTFNNALIMRYKNFDFEAGYNLFARESESVKLKQPWSEKPGLKATNGIATNSKRDITANRILNFSVTTAINDAAVGYVSIKESDIDLKSAAHPSYLSHTVYGAFGYHCNSCSVPFGLTYGGSYEFASNDYSMSRWAMWLKADVSF